MSRHVTVEELTDHHYGGQAVDERHLEGCPSCAELSDRVARERTALREACLLREPEPAGLVRQFPAMRFGAAAVGFCAVLITILWTVRQDPPEPASVPLEAPEKGGGGQAEAEDYCHPGLLWLALHQDEDGSWGRRPTACRCPAEGMPPARRRDLDVERKAREHLAGLSHDDPAERERAAAALRKLGEAAEPVLEQAAVSVDSEVRARAWDLLREFARGREKPDVEGTGLALVAFMGAGYSHLSKDVHGGVCFGSVMRSGLLWLMRHQDADGAVGLRPPEGLNAGNALGALALSEIYGMTGSSLFKDQAQKAVDFVCGRQRPSGAWGPGRDDLTATMASVELVFSARISELTTPEGVLERGREWLRRGAEAGGRESAAYLYATALGVGAPALKGSREKEEARKVFHLPETKRFIDSVSALKPAELDPFTLYLGSHALLAADGSSGPAWKSWNERMKNALIPRRKRKKDGCAGDSWDPESRPPTSGSRVWVTALHALTLEVYYRYANLWDQK